MTEQSEDRDRDLVAEETAAAAAEAAEIGGHTDTQRLPGGRAPAGRGRTRASPRASSWPRSS